MKASFVLILLAFCASCNHSQTAPDNTIKGGALGAGWGAGAGAIIGKQVSYAGEGAAIGSGFGLVAGALSGYAFDSTEDNQAILQNQLASLKIQNLQNRESLKELQSKLDEAIAFHPGTGIYQVFFDEDMTSLRTGAVANLEVLADSLKANPHAYKINVIGHADDSGSPEHNQKLSEARARTVSAYLAIRGISNDQITVKDYGSTRPIASNSTPVGRQLNRRVDIYIGQ